MGGLPEQWAGNSLHVVKSLVEKGLVSRVAPRRFRPFDYFRVTTEGLNYLSENDEYYIFLKLEQQHKKSQQMKRLNHVDNYVHELQDWRTIHNARFCPQCFHTTKLYTCEKCDSKTEYLDVRARPPKRNASKQRWQEFLQIFKPDILKNPKWWQNRNRIINNAKG